jgi:hypothetical protein
MSLNVKSYCAQMLTISGGILSLYLAAVFFYRFRNTFPFENTPPYHWLAMCILFALIAGFSYGTPLFTTHSNEQIHFFRSTFFAYASPVLAILLASLYLASRLQLGLADLLFLDVRSSVEGPISLILMLQPILAPLWLGVAIGKAIAHPAHNSDLGERPTQIHS